MHEEASKLRDTGQSRSTQDDLKADPELMARVSKRNTSMTAMEDEEVLFEQLWSDANSPAVLEEEASAGVANLKEKRMIDKVECYVIMLMDNIPGQLEITNKHLYFFSNPTEKNLSQICELMELKECQLLWLMFKGLKCFVICVCIMDLPVNRPMLLSYIFKTCLPVKFIYMYMSC